MNVGFNVEMSGCLGAIACVAGFLCANTLIAAPFAFILNVFLEFDLLKTTLALAALLVVAEAIYALARTAADSDK